MQISPINNNSVYAKNNYQSKSNHPSFGVGKVSLQGGAHLNTIYRGILSGIALYKGIDIDITKYVKRVVKRNWGEINCYDVVAKSPSESKLPAQYYEVECIYNKYGTIYSGCSNFDKHGLTQLGFFINILQAILKAEKYMVQRNNFKPRNSSFRY